jgi:hypothetical protein
MWAPRHLSSPVTARPTTHCRTEKLTVLHFGIPPVGQIALFAAAAY